jgi:Domain of unknown function (DUF4190)/zinc-ribbon domain
VLCPHCGHENPEGRRYCRGCAKPLKPEAAVEKPAALPNPQQLSTKKPPLSKLALASLVLSFFSLLVPFGIAAVVLGHLSRNQIARSGGKLRGTGVAFAALIFGYVQIVIGSALFLGAVGLLFQFNQELNRNPDARAALVDKIMHHNPKKLVAEDGGARQHYAIDALRIIREKESDYFRTHPEEGYTARADQIGNLLDSGTELGALVAKSEYNISIARIGLRPDPWYVAFAAPRADPNTAPNFCLDSTGVIYRYTPEQEHDVIAWIYGVNPQLCPVYGERVEQ